MYGVQEKWIFVEYNINYAGEKFMVNGCWKLMLMWI